MLLPGAANHMQIICKQNYKQQILQIYVKGNYLHKSEICIQI